MKQLLIILAIFLTTTSYCQIVRDIQYFHTIKNNNDSTLKYFMSFLNKFDDTNELNNSFCEKASERVGDYYKSRRDYQVAISYYDSADTKYRDKLQFCGNAYYMDFIPRRFKISQCYLKLNNINKAIATLTPYIFDNFGGTYFDSSMTSYYLTILKQRYTKQEIRAELQDAIERIKLNYHYTIDTIRNSIHVNCKIVLFNTKLELAGFDTSTESGYQIPLHATKDFLISRFKELAIYKHLLSQGTTPTKDPAQ